MELCNCGTITPIISPQVGHGHDAVEELGGHFVILNTKFEQEEGNDITVANDFRQVGIMKNPTQFNSSTLFTVQLQEIHMQFTYLHQVEILMQMKK